MSTLEADQHADTVFEVDLSIALVSATDKVWFYAKHKYTDIDDDAVVKLGHNVAGLSGIAITSEENGILQVQIAAADLADVIEEALLYEVKVRKADVSKAYSVKKGVLRIAKGVVQATS